MNTNKKMGYLICESAAELSDVKIIKQQNRRVVGRGRLQTANEKNRNGRWYSDDELFPQISCPRTQELINAGYLRAESGHPLSKDLVRQQTIDPSNVCAKFLKMWTENFDVKADFVGTNNALGEAFNQDLLDGDKPAWSLRALGSLENTRNGAEVRNLKLITYDHVIYPSHPGAYTEGIISESATSITDSKGRIISTEKDATKSYILPFTNESVIKYIQNESSNFKLIKECFDILYTTMDMIDESHVSLIDSDGNQIVLFIEDYISNEIINYCARK